MPVIDTHAHVGLTKYRPVEELISLLDQHQVANAVVVQFHGNTDNGYLVDCLERYPGRLAAIALVDPTRRDVTESVRQLADAGVVGLRLPTLGVSADWDQLWATMVDLGLVASVSAALDEFSASAVAQVATRYPTLTLRLEHLGHPDLAEGPPYPRFDRLLALAAHPNVVTTLSGFYSFSRAIFPYEDIRESAQRVVATFGARRCMWGSDWPPIEDREGYGAALRFMMDMPLDETDREWILWRTAASVFRVEPNEA